MKVRIDQSACSGHAMCNFNAPMFFVLDSDGYTALDGELEVPPGEEEAVRRGAHACPERVITVVEE